MRQLKSLLSRPAVQIALIAVAGVALIVATFLLRMGSSDDVVSLPAVDAPSSSQTLTAAEQQQKALEFTSFYNTWSWDTPIAQWESAATRLTNLPPGERVKFPVAGATYASCLDVDCVMAAPVDSLTIEQQSDGSYTVLGGYAPLNLRVDEYGFITAYVVLPVGDNG